MDTIVFVRVDLSLFLILLYLFWFDILSAVYRQSHKNHIRIT